MTDRDESSLRDHTRRVWQPRAGRNLTDDDCREIESNLIGFLSVLADRESATAQVTQEAVHQFQKQE